MKKILLILMCLPICSFAEKPAFLQPPQYVGAPDAAHQFDNRALTMVSSLAVAPNGRLWATWYAGITPGEDHNNYIVLATSVDDGESWQEVLVVDPDLSGPARAFDPEIWLAPDGNLFWTWAQAQKHDGRIAGVWAIKITNPEAAQPQYESPVRWLDGIMMCKPIVLSTGEWVVPTSTWQTDYSAKMAVSTDQGKSWTIRGAANVPKKDRTFDEHMIVERKDGSLWLLCRTKYGIGESVSHDRGMTWTELAPSSIPHPSARFFIHRLQSGNLLLVKHGAMDKKTGRSHLRAFVSSDEGRTWLGGLLLDEREAISYPDGQQAADGTIYITYDRSRTREREILFASFREEDVLSGDNVSGDVKLRQLISKGSGGSAPQRTVVPTGPRNDNSDGVALNEAPAGAIDASEYSLQQMKVGEVLFSDRKYTLKELPQALRGFSFLRAPLVGERDYICSTSGMIYFLTPRPNRNWESQEASLLEQGFERVALPEMQLFSFGKGDRQLCSLYQKHCKKGESIRLSKWAVPVLSLSVSSKL